MTCKTSEMSARASVSCQNLWNPHAPRPPGRRRRSSKGRLHCISGNRFWLAYVSELLCVDAWWIIAVVTVVVSVVVAVAWKCCRYKQIHFTCWYIA